jgi:NAD(P)-dependent dehydrogenase (short-subunit alcohol dehydrogenase family)
VSDDLAGSVVLITGAGAGIGQALAERFRSDGAVVAGCDLHEQMDGCTAVCDLARPCDVTDAAEVERFVAEVVDAYGRIDALIANAGIGRRGRIDEVPWEDVEGVVRVNLFGVLHSIRAVLPVMKEQGRGRIVSLVSRNAELCPGGLIGYNASKAAVIATTRTLAHELDGTDVLANNLIPGPALTSLNPAGTRDPDSCYPTARMLVTLPAGGPSGKTFFDEREYPMFELFVKGVRHPRERT